MYSFEKYPNNFIFVIFLYSFERKNLEAFVSCMTNSILLSLTPWMQLSNDVLSVFKAYSTAVHQLHHWGKQMFVCKKTAPQCKVYVCCHVTQNAEGGLNKTVRPMDGTYTGWTGILQGFQKCLALNPRLKGKKEPC